MQKHVKIKIIKTCLFNLLRRSIFTLLRFTHIPSRNFIQCWYLISSSLFTVSTITFRWFDLFFGFGLFGSTLGRFFIFKLIGWLLFCCFFFSWSLFSGCLVFGWRFCTKLAQIYLVFIARKNKVLGVFDLKNIRATTSSLC